MDDFPTAVRAIHGQSIDRATADDKSWFEGNPDRIFRLRDVMPFENNGPLEEPPDGTTWRALIAQMEPGKRLRAIVAVPAEIQNEADDKALGAIFNRVAPKPFRKALKKARERHC
jgi:hypothetical protein